MATKKSAESRSATTDAQEKIQGLQPAPAGGAWVIRERGATDAGNNEPVYDWEMVLRIEGEEDYVTPLNSLDDGSISGGAYTLIAQRKARLRESKVSAGEIEVVPAT